MVRTTYNSREDWLNGRLLGIGASEAAAVVGAHPWITGGPLQLWRQKTGLEQRKSVSSNEAVSRGVAREPILREYYTVKHPDMVVEYHQFDTLAQEGSEWLFATLDGELTDKSGRKGILEIKTSACSKKTDWEKWNGKIPEYYYIQILHQLLATGFDFVELFADLENLEGDSTVRTYHFEREDCQNDLVWLLGEEKAFWRHIQTRTPPKGRLSF